MASAPIIPLVSVEEYLSSSWERDMEYVDGVLIERTMPTVLHGALQILLGILLGQYRKQFGFTIVSKVRVETIAGGRYRLPDVMLLPRHTPADNVVRQAPWAVIEILSPDDRLTYQFQRYAEFWARGTREIIVLDPETSRSFRWKDNGLYEAPITDGIRLPNGQTVPFSTEEVFAQLREEISESSGESSESSSR